MKKYFKTPLMLFLGLMAFHAIASEIDLQTFTLFQIRQRALSQQEEKSEYLLYEYIDLSLKDIGKEGLSFSAYGWGRGASNLAFDEERESGALSYAYLSYRTDKWNSAVRLGRIFTFSGSSFEQFDGFTASAEFLPGWNVKIFGGSPVNYTFSRKGRGDLIYGTRLSHSYRGIVDVGINYLREDDNSHSFREEAGFDLWLKPAKFIGLSGHAFYNNVTENLSDYRASLFLKPHKKLTISAEFSKYIYSDYFFASPLSVFHFQDGEELEKLRVGIDTPVTQKLSFYLDYLDFHFKVKDSSNLYRAGMRYQFGDEGSYVGFSLQQMDSTVKLQKYEEIQSFFFFNKSKFQGSLFLIGTFYEEPIFGVDNVYQILASSGIKIKDNLILSADIQLDKNPQYDKATTGMIRLKYNFSKE